MNAAAAKAITERLVESRRAELGNRKFVKLAADDMAGLLATIDGLSEFGESAGVRQWACDTATALRRSIAVTNPGVKKTEALWPSSQREKGQKG